jgi:hypothetical protein
LFTDILDDHGLYQIVEFHILSTDWFSSSIFVIHWCILWRSCFTLSHFASRYNGIVRGFWRRKSVCWKYVEYIPNQVTRKYTEKHTPKESEAKGWVPVDKQWYETSFASRYNGIVRGFWRCLTGNIFTSVKTMSWSDTHGIISVLLKLAG